MVRLFFTRLFGLQNEEFAEDKGNYGMESWCLYNLHLNKEIYDVLREHDKKIYPWPSDIAPTRRDIQKLETIVSSLPPGTRQVVNSFADAEVVSGLQMLTKSTSCTTNWIQNLLNKSLYNQFFFTLSGRKLVENILISNHFSKYLDERPDRVALLNEYYTGFIKNGGVPLSLPVSMSCILPLSPKANRNVTEYIQYRRNLQFGVNFERLTKMAQYPDSIVNLDVKNKKEKFEEIDSAVVSGFVLLQDFEMHGYVPIRKIGEGAYKDVWKIKEDIANVKRDLVFKMIKDKPDKSSSHDEDNMGKIGGRNELITQELQRIEDLRKNREIPIPQLHRILAQFTSNYLGWIEDHIDGQNLEQKYAKLRDQYGALSPEVVQTASRDFIQISQIMSKIHEEKVLHRDIKLENFLQENKSGQIYITDFGLSSFGTYGARKYAAPEVINSNGEEYSEYSESWSLGVALFRAITGDNPFGNDKDEAIELLKDKEKTEQAAKKAINKIGNIYQDIQTLLYFCWNYEPEKRLLMKNLQHSLSLKTDSLSQYENIYKAFEHFDKYISFHDDTTLTPEMKDTIIKVFSGLRKLLDWQYDKK